MSAHTDGPWVASPVPGDRLKRWVVTSPGPGRGKPVVAERIRTKANALLIAAAPDMYEALKYIADSDEPHEPSDWAINTARHLLKEIGELT